MLGTIVKPNRRHRCEICDSIFECHLCNMNADHQIHANVLRKKDKVLICVGCAIEKHLLFVLQIKDKKWVNIYNYLTGRVTYQIRISCREWRFRRWYAVIPKVKSQIILLSQD